MKFKIWNPMFVCLVVIVGWSCNAVKTTPEQSAKVEEVKSSKTPPSSVATPKLKTKISTVKDLEFNLKLSKQLLKTEKDTKTRFEIIDGFPKQIEKFLRSLDVSGDATQAYLLKLNQSSAAEHAKIRKELKDRKTIHDTIDALEKVGVFSICSSECMDSLLEFDSKWYFNELSSLTSEESSLLAARDYCDRLGLDEGMYFSGDVAKFTAGLDALIQLQKGKDLSMNAYARNQEKQCWEKWLSLCSDDCGDIHKTLPPLIKSFPHMKKALDTYKKETLKLKDAPDNLKELVESAFEK